MREIVLYHASPTKGLKELRPSVTIYFGKPKQMCLAALLPMALMYGVKHFEYPYGYTRDGQIHDEEYFPNAFRAVYGGKSASLYRCLWREDMPAARRAWVLEAETQAILERNLLHEDGTFARCMREQYPRSWALAQEREGKGAAHP